MTDNNYSFDESQLFEYSELIEGLAKVGGIEKSSYCEIAQTTGKLNKQAIEDVFDLMLELIAIQSQADDSIKRFYSRQQMSLHWDALAPTLGMKLSLIGLAFFLVAAVLAALITPTAILPVIIYIFICFCCLVVFVLLGAVKESNFFKSREKEISDFKTAKNHTVLFELPNTYKIIQKANYQLEVLQYVENKFQLDLEREQDNIKLANKFLRIGLICVLAIVVFNFILVQILLNPIFSSNVSVLSAFLTIASAVVAGGILMLEFLIDSRQKFKVSSYKMCLYYLRQAKVLVS